jgi:hypothetical protein
MRCAPKTDIFKVSLRSMVEIDPFVTLGEANTIILDGTGVSASERLVPVALRTLGYNRKVLVHSRPSSTEIATTASVELSDPYRAQGRRSIFSVDETCCFP